MLIFTFGIIYFWLLNDRRFYNDTGSRLAELPTPEQVIDGIFDVDPGSQKSRSAETGALATQAVDSTLSHAATETHR